MTTKTWKGNPLARMVACALCVVLLDACGDDQQDDSSDAPRPTATTLVFVDEDSSVGLTLTGVDEQDAETDLDVDVTVDPEHGALDVTSGSAPLAVTYTPAADYHGIDSLQYTVTDRDGNSSDAATVVLVVEPVNEPPLARDDPGAGDPLTTDTVTPLVIHVLANDTDPEGDPLRVVSTSSPSSGSVEIASDGRLTYTPEHPRTGTVSFDYTVDDDRGGQDSATVTLDVTLGQPVEIVSFATTADLIAAGDGAELSWTTLAATGCRIDPDVGPVAVPDGTVTVEPVASTDYALTCEGPLGPAVAHATVGVSYDSDGDGILDVVETQLGYDPEDTDMDDDGRPDGSEDLNANGLVDPGETDPLDADSDDDDWCDGPRTDNDGDGIAPEDDCTGTEFLLVRAEPVTESPDGLRWETAFNSLEAVLAAVQPGQQVWVAAGTYRDEAGGAAVLTMAPGVDLHGGFDGDEHALAERPDPLAPTILDGEMQRRVVVGASDALLDGFVITRGQAVDGGGMHNQTASPELVNVTFDGNAASDRGGGMYNVGSSPVLNGVTFKGNYAPDGGGMANWSGSSPALTNVWFVYNSAYAGGGISNDESSPQLESVAFINNTAGLGGGIYGRNGSSPVLTNVTISGNLGTNEWGGGMHNWEASSVLTNVTFSGNSCVDKAGGMYNYRSSPVLTNVTFIGNTAGNRGGAMENNRSPALLTNVTFVDNAADNQGGGIYNIWAGPTVINSVFWSSSGGDVYNHDSPDASVAYTCSGQNLGSITIAEDPFYVPFASGQAFLDPVAGAPCIDAGDNATADAAFAPASWQALTTRSDGLTESEVNGVGTELVDLGRHYDPAAVRILTFRLSDDLTSVVWTTGFASECLMVFEDEHDLVPISADEIDAGGLPIPDIPRGVEITLVCAGAAGEPAVATLTAP